MKHKSPVDKKSYLAKQTPEIGDVIVWETDNEVCILCSNCKKLRICRKRIKGDEEGFEEFLRNL